MAPIGHTVTSVSAGLERRALATAGLARQAEELAVACSAIAERIRNGGRVIAVSGVEAASDARHVAVEFLHPAVVGKRAVPAFALVCTAATDAMHRLPSLGRAQDVAVVIGRTRDDPVVRNALRTARALGMFTLALVSEPSRPAQPAQPAESAESRVAGEFDEAGTPGEADLVLAVPSDDPLVTREVHTTAYHLLWELTQLFLEHGEPSDDYPFLSRPADRGILLKEAAEAVRVKSEELTTLRAQVATDLGDELLRCGKRLAEAFSEGARLYMFGNGGSATDASGLAATFLVPPRGRPLPALALSDDTAVVTALTNDAGFEVVFARQLDALARPGDVAFGLSTSGGSANVVRGLERARRRGLVTVGSAGDGGGAMAAPGLADHLFVVPSRSVHRVQEAQAMLGHLLWETVQEGLCASGCPGR